MPASAKSTQKSKDTDDNSLQFKEASRRLKEHSENGQPAHLRLVEIGIEIEMSAAVGRTLAEVFLQMAAGNAVAVTLMKVEMTTQEAADLLYVSRPYLISLLDTGQIPSRKVGTHRRILREDVAAYKARIDDARLATLQELAAQAQELGMGY